MSEAPNYFDYVQCISNLFHTSIYSCFISFAWRDERELDNQVKWEIVIALWSSKSKVWKSQREVYIFIFYPT